MAKNQTMAQLLQAPTGGYEDAIVIPEIAATNFELKHAWDRFNDLLRECPHHGFSELHQLDTFYNALNVNDQDSLNSAAGGNFLDKMLADCLKIIESKSKVRQTRAKAVVAKLDLKYRPTSKSSDNLSDIGFQSIIGCKHLVSLSLRRSQKNHDIYFNLVIDVGMFLLAEGCKQLEYVRLDGFNKVTDTVYARVLNACLILKKFEIRHGVYLEDLAFQDLSKVCKLSLLEEKLVSCFITSEVVRKPETCSASMKVLNLCGCPRLSDSALSSISRLASLTYLNLEGTDVTDAGSEGKMIKTLSSLDLGYMVGVTDYAITTICDACLELTELSIRNCKNVTHASNLASKKPFFCGLRWIGIGLTNVQSVQHDQLAQIFKGRRVLTICKHGVNLSTSASGSQPSGNTKKDKIQQTPSSSKKNKIEAHPRNSNVNFDLQYVTCNGCLFSDNHDSCVLEFINNVNARVKSKSVKKTVKKKVWKPTGKVFINIGYIWRPTGRTFTIVGNTCPLTRITTTAKVPLRKPISLESCPNCSLVFRLRLLQAYDGDRSQLPNFVDKFLGTVKFDGLGHNLFSVGKFCDSDLEVSFRQHTCFIRNLKGVDLLSGSRGNNLYTLSLGDMMKSSPICLLSKASKTNSWLWHRRLSHLNFGAINYLGRQGLVRGLPKLKFKKDHLYSACAMGKCKKKSHKPKSEDTNKKKLYLLHMDLCGPMRVESVNGKKYILVIVGISHETYVARSPQQNGVVERRNRTLIEAACMIAVVVL
nr:hypothetical protein [Tanacetum cinerariifolium]